MLKSLIKIGIKAKKASKIRIESKIKNKVLLKYLQLIKKIRELFLKKTIKI